MGMPLIIYIHVQSKCVDKDKHISLYFDVSLFSTLVSLPLV